MDVSREWQLLNNRIRNRLDFRFLALEIVGAKITAAYFRLHSMPEMRELGSVLAVQSGAELAAEGQVFSLVEGSRVPSDLKPESGFESILPSTDFRDTDTRAERIPLQ